MLWILTLAFVFQLPDFCWDDRILSCISVSLASILPCSGQWLTRRASLLRKALTLLHLPESLVAAKDYPSGRTSLLALGISKFTFSLMLPAADRSEARWSALSRRNLFKWTEYQQQSNLWWSLGKYPHSVILLCLFCSGSTSNQLSMKVFDLTARQSHDNNTFT